MIILAVYLQKIITKTWYTDSFLQSAELLHFTGAQKAPEEK